MERKTNTKLITQRKAERGKETPKEKQSENNKTRW